MKRLAWALLAFPFIVAFSSQEPTKPKPISFKDDLMPIVDKSCVGCHGRRASGGLDLRTPEAWEKGGRSGKLWDLEEIEKSLLLIRIETDKKGPQMPKMAKPLKEEDMAKFRTWVKEGAKFDIE